MMTNNASYASKEVAQAEQIFVSGADHFAALLKDIGEAKKTIELETYLFEKDHLGIRVAKALSEAAKRGVTVRVMVDGAGSPYWTTNFARLLEESGALTKVFHPFPWQLWNWSRSVVKLPILLKWVYFLLKANFRNHRKVCIIDNKVAYIGSFNVSKCHLEQTEGGDGWRDTSARLENIDLTEFNKAFDAAWNHRTIKERLRDAFAHIRRDPPIRLNYTRHRRRILYKTLLRQITQCKERIWITNAYFVPNNFLLRRLREAAHNGIDVRILLPQKSDVFMMPWASSTFYYRLLLAGVKIFEYLPSMLHAKTLILDDWILVGSSNLNHRSLLHDLEADIRIYSEEAKRYLTERFLEDLQQSREISLDSWYIHRPMRQRFLGRLVLYLKYWI